MERFRGTGVRGMEDVLNSLFFEGRFGCMFRRLPVFEPEPDSLRTLADSMRESGPPLARSPRHSVSSSFSILMSGNCDGGSNGEF